jgi:hypothetical protein
MVAGEDYRPFFRHELSHTFVPHRWGPRRAGPWMDEGLATRATGECQSHTVDAVAAGYAASGRAPSLEALTGNDFYAIPELPGYFTAASFINFLHRTRGIEALRGLWQGKLAGVDESHPLGVKTQKLRVEWERALKSVPPASLDTVRLGRSGC